MSGRAVAGIILHADGRILFSRRGRDASSYVGMWEFPGGSLLPAEDPLEGLAREMREEVGIRIMEGAVLLREGQHQAPNGLWETRTYVIKNFAGTPLLMEPGKASEIAFFNPIHPPQPLIPEAEVDLHQYLSSL